MKYTTPIAIAIASFASAQLGIDDSDVPDICRQICQPIISLSAACSNESSTDSSCICKNTSFDVINLGSLCYMCAEQVSALNDDLRSVSSACSFTQGQYNQLSASSVAATVVVTATHSGSVVTTSATTSDRPSSSATAASGGASSSSGNYAPVMTRAAGLLAGAGAVAAGLIL